MPLGCALAVFVTAAAAPRSELALTRGGHTGAFFDAEQRPSLAFPVRHLAA